MKVEISDNQLNAYYAKNYYGKGTDYFDPPEETESKLCFVCGKDIEESEEICFDCKWEAINALRKAMDQIKCTDESIFYEIIHAVWDEKGARCD